MSTVNKTIKISGQGIHSGEKVNIVIKPSDKKGIFFKRVDMVGTDFIPAVYHNVGETKMRNTTIGDMSGAYVQTIEHLMAALFIVGIDSAIVEIDGAETPIIDGSAAEFIKEFQNVGTTGGKHKRVIVKREVIVKAKEVFKQLSWFDRLKIWFFNKMAGRKIDGFVRLSPNDGAVLNINATLVYPEKIIGRQSFSYSFDETAESVEDFVENVARARTFGKYSEWEYLKKHGMGRGANENNVIALNDAGDGTINELIWPDEFVRHKIIDVVGDLFTSGAMLCADVESYKGSHAMNNLVLRKLFSNPENYDIINVE